MKDLDFGDRLKKLRKRRDLTQTELAKIIGISYGAIQVHEGGRMPHQNNLNRYIDFYKCRREWLLTGIGPTYQLEKKLSSKHHIIDQSAPTNTEARQDEKGYDSHGDGKSKLDMPEWDVLGKAHDILTSNSVFKVALTQNIKAFHAALQAENDKTDLNTRLKNIESLVAKLSEENAQLKKKAAEYRRKEQRRQRDLGPPGEGERRSGIDRRQSSGG